MSKKSDDLLLLKADLVAQEKSIRHHFYHHNNEAQRWSTRYRLTGDKNAKRTSEDARAKADELNIQHKNTLKQLTDIQHEIDSLDSEARLAILMKSAKGFDFDIPNDDPFFEVLMLSGIASSLQYWYVNNTSYYEYLIKESFSRVDDEGNDTGGTGEDTPVHGIGQDALDKLEHMRDQRYYAQTLRAAVELAYDNAVKKLDDDASFVPKLLQRSDDQLASFIADRKGKSFKAQRNSRDEAIAKSIEVARKEDNTYQPKVEEDDKPEGISI